MKFQLLFVYIKGCVLINLFMHSIKRNDYFYNALLNVKNACVTTEIN